MNSRSHLNLNQIFALTTKKISGCAKIDQLLSVNEEWMTKFAMKIVRLNQAESDNLAQLYTRRHNSKNINLSLDQCELLSAALSRWSVSRKYQGGERCNRLLLNIPWRKQRRSRLKVDAGRCWSHANPLLGLLTKQFSRKTTAAACFDIHNFTHFYINYEQLLGL